VARLYVTKSAFAAFLILVIGTTSTAYPLLPRHFTIAAALTIGIPTFFLALAPSHGPWPTTSWLDRTSSNNRVSTPAVKAVWLPPPWQAIATSLRSWLAFTHRSLPSAQADSQPQRDPS
jgi:hypothetical protein